jgi:hypothetical protein
LAAYVRRFPQYAGQLQLQAELHLALDANPSALRPGKVWELPAWQREVTTPLLTLKGHGALVTRVAFSPDGRRLASAGRDQSVRVWDVPTDADLVAQPPLIPQAKFPVLALAFSPDGRRLASIGLDHAARVRETTPPTQEVRLQRQAVRLLDSLFLTRVRKADMLDQLRRDPKLGEPLHQEALARAERYLPDASRLDAASRATARQPGAKPAVYCLAMLQGEEACRLEPENGTFRTTLALAQYHAGKYPEVLATLQRSGTLPPGPGVVVSAGYPPIDLALLAMTRHQLGQVREARAALASLHIALGRNPALETEEMHAFAREADTVIEGQAQSPKP